MPRPRICDSDRVSINVYLSDELKEFVERESDRLEMSRSEYIRDLIGRKKYEHITWALSI